MLKKLCVFMMTSLMIGCGGITSSTAPTTTFVAQVNYKDVFERAKEQANYCWRSITDYPIVANLNETDKTVEVYVTGLLGSTRMAELSGRAINNNSTEVKIAASGVNIWNRGAVKAMREAVEFGVPTCTSYMPTKE